MRNPTRSTLGLLLLASSLAAACGGSATTAPTTSTTTTITPTNGCFALGLTSGRTAIVNGTACTGTNSSVVLLDLRDASNTVQGSCSGTVIGTRAVITAAHCLAGIDHVNIATASAVVAHSTSLNIASGGFDVGIVITDADIGLRVIPLLTSRAATVGEQAVVAGWGQDENNGHGVLKAGSTSISGVTSTTLQTQYSGSGTSGVCWGDSGGALLLSQGGVWVLAGVTSALSSDTSCAANTTDYYSAMRNSTLQSFVVGLVSDVQQK